MIDASLTQSIRNLADEAAIRLLELRDPRDPDAKAIPVIIDPASKQIVSVKGRIDEWRLRPEHVRGRAEAHTLNGFIDMVNHHKTPATLVFLASGFMGDPRLEAVTDYHGKAHADPSFLRHRIGYSFPLSEEFKAWRGFMGRSLSVRDFAELIEDRIADLAAPTQAEENEGKRLFSSVFATPSEMVKLSRGLQVRVNATVAESRTLQSGESEITFAEEHKGADGKKLEVPGLFLINIPIFDGAPRRPMMCRLRYRVTNNQLSWAFIIHDVTAQLRAAIEDDIAVVTEKTGVPVFIASPEA